VHVTRLHATTPRAIVDSWYALRAATDLELEPHVPPPRFEEALASATSDEQAERLGWLMVDEGAVVGYATLELPLLDNPQLAMLDVRIDAGRRRAGLARTLTRLAASAAQDAGRRSALVEAVDGTAGAAACAALGATAALASTSSTLRLTDLDRSLVEHWMKRRHDRASGYTTVLWSGPCPQDLVEPFAQLREVMNTAPLGDLDMTVEWTPESIRAAERSHIRCGRRNHVLCARHVATGELVGLTDVTIPIARPTIGQQEDTVVRPDHRNRGLGRWLKAEMLTWLAQTEPQLELIVTWNATENAAMLAINTELGFVRDQTWTEWQFAVADLVARLG
jgi:GNAT superfamily N-acetyltransferase